MNLLLLLFKDPDWRPSADVPDDADADGLTEVDDDSETSDDSLSFDMDNADTRPIDGRGKQTSNKKSSINLSL